ncbi:MAG: DUF2279 domain-containing protein [gamma proteobacterium endosymbiont of Lamellibrachia anaximandri]|nr:DUF2279 domain-containing protein [gamma proteobacterium endosymbiont of Lamellibrachia anaximandri]MBL3535732.1 DUF2279 domain-containing protein [gamma proteobacterium endosymbiont of Lamellibrachia anaximandri]
MPAYAVEYVATYCNDNLFNSDGGGLSYCFETAAHFDYFSVGAGLYAVTDEKKKGRRDPSDRLDPLSRLSFLANVVNETENSTYVITPRIGFEGGFVDDLSIRLQSAMHSALGIGQRDVVSTHGTRFLLGLSGFSRTQIYEKTIQQDRDFTIEPYFHGSIGNDTAEFGGGMFLSLQPEGEQHRVALSLPKNGSYLSERGGEGVALYIGGRTVAHESLYGDLENHLLAEIGGVAQISVYNTLNVGAGASCTTQPYQSALRSDCIVEVGLALDFDAKTTAFDYKQDLRNDLSYYQLGGGYGFSTFKDHFYSVPLEVAGLLGGITALGLHAWDWDENTSFHFQSEGFLGEDTGSFGMDKFGHAYSSYLIAEFLTHHIRKRARDPSGAAFSSAILATVLMTYVELFDGYALDHGFSYEDMIFNVIGIGLSSARNLIPGLHDKVDFRLEYIPSGNTDSFGPITDYSGQKYLFALKASGFDMFEDSFLKYFELQAGYFARGFTEKEEQNNEPSFRRVFWGLGLNLQELLFGAGRIKHTAIGQDARRILEYVQVPYTNLVTD